MEVNEIMNQYQITIEDEFAGELNAWVDAENEEQAIERALENWASELGTDIETLMLSVRVKEL